MSEKVVRVPFVQNRLILLEEKLTDLIYELGENHSIAEIIGILEIIKLDLRDRARDEGE